MLKEEGNEGRLPELECGEYIINLLHEIGPVMHIGDGVTAVSYTEMHSWSLLTGVKLTAWETTAIRQLSVAFAREATLSKNPQRPAPWLKGVIDKAAISSGIEKAFAAFAKRQKKRQIKRK